MEMREDVSGSVTQPSACYPVAAIVGFAVEVCGRINAESAIHEVGGVVIIASSSFSGSQLVEHDCAQCLDRRDLFIERKKSVSGTYSESVKYYWHAVAAAFPHGPCNDAILETEINCGTIACSVTKSTKTFRILYSNKPCCTTPPGVNPPCCGQEVCP